MPQLERDSVARAVPELQQRPRPSWERTYASLLPVLDALLVAVTAFVVLLTADVAGPVIPGVADSLTLACLAPTWIALLGVRGCYESRVLGEGVEEYKRVLNGCVLFGGLLAVLAYATDTEVPRSLLIATVLPTTLAVLLGRNAARRVLIGLRRRGVAVRSLLLVGPPDVVRELAREVGSDSAGGYRVIGVCTSWPESAMPTALGDLAVLGGTWDAAAVISSAHVDCVAVVGSADMPTGFIRQLAWQLEGSGVDLMVAPAITDVAGPRIHVRPVANLSLLFVEEPQFSGPRRVLKSAFDRLLALLLLTALLPLLAMTAVAIKATSPGPVFFRQRRLGLHGEDFLVWKFRSMRQGADAEKALLAELNEGDGNLFKIREDPRITPLGRLLRRLSIDELPQLINVVTGTMSLVGPRPLPESLEQFDSQERRRLLVKPGITGLWQVSGRSDLTWDESVRLDLYYVENWSLALDVTIMVRTVAVVLRGGGAY